MKTSNEIIEKEFIRIVESIALNRIGFDVLCLKGWDNVGCPTYSQAFRWFRDKHNLHSEPVWDIIDGELVWFFSITEIGNVIDDAIDLPYCKTYEEAELACLRQLILIVIDNSFKLHKDK